MGYMECGRPLPLWFSQRSGDPPPGVSKSCRGLQDYGTITFIGPLRGQLQGASLGKETMVKPVRAD